MPGFYWRKGGGGKRLEGVKGGGQSGFNRRGRCQCKPTRQYDRLKVIVGKKFAIGMQLFPGWIGKAGQEGGLEDTELRRKSQFKYDFFGMGKKNIKHKRQEQDETLGEIVGEDEKGVSRLPQVSTGANVR